MDETLNVRLNEQNNADGLAHETGMPLVVVIEDGVHLSDAFRSVCDCLDVAVERMSSRDDLGNMLRDLHPMAVVAEMDAAGQDGCNVLMTIAAHNRDLPVLLIIGEDPALLGAVDAVEEIWELSSVVKWPELLGVGAVVDFLFRAGLKGRCMRLMPV
jgi:hypothetical protein